MRGYTNHISKGKRHIEFDIHVLIDVVSWPVTDGRCAFSPKKVTGVYSLVSSKGIASNHVTIIMLIIS